MLHVAGSSFSLNTTNTNQCDYGNIVPLNRVAQLPKGTTNVNTKRHTTIAASFVQMILVYLTTSNSFAQLPSIKRVVPAGVTRGVKTTITIEGSDLTELSMFFSRGPCKLSPIRYDANHKSVNFDLTVDALALPGPLQMRVANRLGASPPISVWVDVLPSQLRGPEDAITLDHIPVSLDGTLTSNSDRQVAQFNANSGETWVFDIVAGRVGSPASPRIDLLDSTGNVLESASTDGLADARIIHTFRESGKFQIATSSATAKHFTNAPYRLSVGKLPTLTSFIPHGERPGRTILMGIDGKNIGGAFKGSLPIPKNAVEGELYGTVRTPAGFTIPFPFLVDADPVASITETDAVMPLPILPGSLEGSFLVYPRTKFYFNAGPREPITFDFFAAKIGSVVEGELQILDDAGNQVALSRAAHGLDAHLDFQPAASGTYTLIASNLTGKIGTDCTYRIKASIAKPDFRLTVGVDYALLSPGGKVTVPVHVERLLGFSGSVTLAAMDLPIGVTCSALTLAATDSDGLLTLTSLPAAVARISTIRFQAFSTEANVRLVHSGILPKSAGEISPSQLFLLIVSPEAGRK